MGSGKPNDASEPIFYVYGWFLKSTGEYFHIGKGKGKRFQDKKNHRNQYFRNMINKYGDDVDVELMVIGLTNDEALNLEREMIAYYKSIGQCKTNLHEGGSGGYTGKYNDPERSRKLSEAASRRVGKLNSNYGNKMSDESRAQISAALKGRPMLEKTKLALKIANTGRQKTQEELDKLSKSNRGKKRSAESVMHNRIAQNSYVYEVFFKEQFMYRSLGRPLLIKMLEDNLNISHSISPQIISGEFTPKFNRHKWISFLRIKYIPISKFNDIRALADNGYEEFNNCVFNEAIKTVNEFQRWADVQRYGTASPKIRKNDRQLELKEVK